jgi:hypothetical protein
MMAALLLAAVAALKQRSLLALPLLLVAALIKAFAIVLLPMFLLMMYRQRWRRERALLSTAVAAAVACAVVLPFWAGGAMIGGVLRGLQDQQQGIATLSIVSLMREYAQQHEAAQMLGTLRLGLAGLFALAAAAVMAAARDVERALAYLLLLAYLLVSSFLPWYLIPVIGLIALGGGREGYGDVIAGGREGRGDVGGGREGYGDVIAGGRGGRVYVFVATALALLSYPVSIWARFESGLSLFQMRLIVAAMVTLPAIALVGLGLRPPTVMPGDVRPRFLTAKNAKSAKSSE